MKVLNLDFINGTGKNKRLNIKNFRESVTAEEVQAAMTGITNANISQDKNMVDNYTALYGAQVTETIITEIF